MTVEQTLEHKLFTIIRDKVWGELVNCGKGVELGGHLEAAQQIAQLMPGWITPDEEVTPCEGRFYACDKYGSNGVVRVEHQGLARVGMVYAEWGNCWIPREYITHWHPLLDVPQPKEGK